jgi:hypothetical protein
MTVDEALGNCTRILQNAETDTDLHLMERLTELANCWARIAELLSERENAT